MIGGLGGDDKLLAAGGNDTICGGAGDDTINASTISRRSGRSMGRRVRGLTSCEGGQMGAATGTRRRGTAGRFGLCCLLGLIIGLGSPAVGRADGLPTVDLSSDPWFVGWSELLPPAYMGVNTDSADICVAGRIECVDRVADRLAQQVAVLGCDHNAVFALAYQRTTEKVAAVQRANPSSSPIARG